MDIGFLQQTFEQQLLQTAQELEQQVDEEIKKLDQLDDDDIERIRQKRLDQLKQAHNQKQTWLQNGHGTYSYIQDQKEFFEAVKKSEKVVVHFFRPTTWRCQILDKHMTDLAAKHIETRFVKVDAEKSPFLVEQLKIQVIPTILLVVKSKVVDRIIGFEDLGSRDDFKTDVLARRLKSVIRYDGNVYEDAKKKEENEDFDPFE